MATTLPPTTHSLPRTQRTNLMRTTRKLGAILGETPILLEPPRGHHAHSSSVSSVSSIESKRSGRIFAFPPSRGPSLEIAEPAPPSPTGATPVSDRPTLLLRLPPAARPRPLSNLSLASPLSPAFPRSPPMSPLTPTIVVDRRKKMAKLVRTLGAHVPPELVFAARPASPVRTVIPSILQSLEPRHQRPPGLRRRMSDASLASPTREAFASTYAAAQFTGADGDADDWLDLAGGYSSSAPASPSPVLPELHFFVQPSSPTSASVDDLHVSTPSSPPAHVSTTTRSTTDTRFLSRHYEFRRADSPFAPTDDYYREDWVQEDWVQKSSTYRREQGWSGEWTGAGGMQDVVVSLRGLRLK